MSKLLVPLVRYSGRPLSRSLASEPLTPESEAELPPKPFSQMPGNS